ncbi:MAG: hypothetical protein U0166_07535 [Acidobacteriota bacterium]
MTELQLREVSWDRMIRAVEKVRERLSRATVALERAGVRYAVVGGNAVASWVSRIDESAVRNTQDVDLLLRREDLPAASDALASAGFLHRHAAGVDMFLDGPAARARDAIHVVFARERVREEYLCASPDVTDSEISSGMRVATLQALVTMKLTSYRLKDRVHLQDLAAVGLIDASWVARVPSALRERLRHVVEHPEE